MNKTRKELAIHIIQSNQKKIKYEPNTECPTKFISELISILNFDKQFNVIFQEFNSFLKLREIRFGTGQKQMLFLSLSFKHRYYPNFDFIDLILTTEHFQVTYRSKDNSDRQKTSYNIYYFGKTNEAKYHLPEEKEESLWTLLIDEHCKDFTS